MARYLMKISYLGTSFCGWQVQNNGNTVQSQMCDAAFKIFGCKTNITGCSRTDSGVHAKEFCCHFDAETKITPEKMVDAFNNNLPDSIAVKSCEKVYDEFHARYWAKGKNYIYKILNSRIPNPFYNGRVLQIKYSLDLEKMQKAAAEMIGTYDFSAFCASNTSVEDKVRTITECEVRKEGDIIQISVSANGFLYNMVRIITGTLIAVGSGKIEPCEIKNIIESKNRENAGPTVAPQGLYLNKVFY